MPSKGPLCGPARREGMYFYYCGKVMGYLRFEIALFSQECIVGFWRTQHIAEFP